MDPSDLLNLLKKLLIEHFPKECLLSTFLKSKAT